MNSEQMFKAQSRARAFVASSILQCKQPVIRNNAEKLAESFILLIHSHITNLAQLAQLYASRKMPLDSVLLEEEFRGHLSSIFEEAAYMKLQLSQSNYNHQCFWPTAGTDFDPACMESVYPLHREQENQVVGFTLFPGLSVQIGDHAVTHVRPAETVIRDYHARKDSASSVAALSVVFG